MAFNRRVRTFLVDTHAGGKRRTIRVKAKDVATAKAKAKRSSHAAIILGVREEG